MVVKGLIDLTTQEVADRIKDLSVEDVRKLLNIKNEYTVEEEAALCWEIKSSLKIVHYVSVRWCIVVGG
ncbi:SKP1-like protein 14 [Acorus gramineus]|uniref:SKP1-like protein 14 n=1 Tax=Acorus gramineus TaxID=55184 RepID=A0AAV9B526_ACOGR|nr:SKP1-like protein 14 [Acorus gramineus]